MRKLLFPVIAIIACSATTGHSQKADSHSSPDVLFEKLNRACATSTTYETLTESTELRFIKKPKLLVISYWVSFEGKPRRLKVQNTIQLSNVDPASITQGQSEKYRIGFKPYPGKEAITENSSGILLRSFKDLKFYDLMAKDKTHADAALSAFRALVLWAQRSESNQDQIE